MQPIDSEYTRKIHEYTTEPFFLSSLVDYLPASSTVPTPKAVLGDIAGAKDNLPYSKEVYTYMRMLEKASPRVRVFSIGKSEEGREMIAVAIASDELIANLDANKAKLAKLADPRTIGMNDATAAEIVNTVAPVYYITGTIHSSESGAPTALMELAYRLAVDESPYIRNIRNNLITLITPIVEVDGRDREVDLFKWHMAHPDETYPNLAYWGHYVAHDNNRDAMGLSLKLTRNVLNTYVDWKAQVLHDLHESVPYLYDNTVGDGPYNAWVDPLLTNEWQMLGWNNVQEMTRLGMPGVYTHGDFDTWSPGYLMFIAATHNGISRLYETFGNGGTAETIDRTLTPEETSRTWFRQNPPLPRVKWSLRNNNNYEQTGLLVSLSYFADNKQQFLENFYEKSKRSVLKARTEGPAAYIFPADDPRPGAQAELLRILQMQHVEISRATAAFSALVPARPGGVPPKDVARQRRHSTDPQRRHAHPRTAAPRRRGVPRGQLHRPHGPAVLAHRRRAARLPVLVAERSAEESVRRHRLDVPGEFCRQGGKSTRPDGPQRADAAGDWQCHRAGRSVRNRFRVRDQPQRRQRAGNTSLQAANGRHSDRRGAVHNEWENILTRIVHHSWCSRRDAQYRNHRVGPPGLRTRRSANGCNAPCARRARRLAAHVDRDSDRRLVASGARRSENSV